jgi:predicted nucleotide-binding protein
MPTILVVDDDDLIRVEMQERVEDFGYDVMCASNYDDAARLIELHDFYCYLLDVNLQGKSGEGLWRLIRRKSATAPIVYCTSYYLRNARVHADRNVHLLIKPITDGELQRRLRSFEDGLSALNLFVVHGHDSSALSALRGFLEEKLSFTKLLVLQEMNGGNATIVEQFEAAAAESDACAVLITPDDINVTGRGKRSKRMRQNVLFELGYFMGKFGRTSGRIVVFVMGDLEMPSDLHGVDFIRVRGDFADISEKIVNDLRQRLLRVRENL